MDSLAANKLALEQHNIRKEALHEILDNTDHIEVVNWGETNDTDSHEFVELILGALGSAVFQYTIVPGLKFIAEELGKQAVDQGTSELVKWIVSKLRPKQEKKEILDYVINLPNGVSFSVDPPDTSASITFYYPDYQTQEYIYRVQDEQQG
jgi:hypothetical protein